MVVEISESERVRVMRALMTKIADLESDITKKPTSCDVIDEYVYLRIFYEKLENG